MDMGASTSKHKTKSNKHRSYIAGKPSSPGKPTLKYDPDNLDPDTVTIKWDPPLFDGGSKITGYLVEHKRTGSPHWVKASPIKVRQTQLTVCGLEPGWRYQFRVSAENEIGLSDPSPLSEPLAIFVHRSAAIAPYFVTELSDIVVLENEKVEFNVSFEGLPSPKISWYKDGLEIFSNRCQKISTEGCVSTLIIYEACISDESEIKCSATNRVGYAVTKAYLKVEAPPTIRLPRQYEEGLIFEKGELIRLKVSVVGQPEPSVLWYLNGDRLNPSPRHEMEYADKTAVLKVKNAQRSDRGEYEIQAMNPLGDDVASILVTIANRPQPPANVFINSIRGRSVTLSWMAPDDDGGCKIGSYIVEYYKTGWNIWLKAATSRQLTMTLDDLIQGSQYKFRVKAENPYGVSDPSPETETVFIPDPKKNPAGDPFTTEHGGSPHPYNTDAFDPANAKDNIPTISDIAKLTYDHIFERESQTETDCSTENSDRKKLLAPVKPKRKKVKKNAEFVKEEDLVSGYEHVRDRHRDDDYRGLTPSPQPSTNMDDTSRTSSELMLVLVPSNEDLANHKGKGSLDGVSSFSSKYEHFQSMPPPISLSAPELGSEMLFFKPLQRNCVSSTEILHESTIARFYKELQEENAINKLKTQVNLLSSKKPIENLADISDTSQQSINSHRNDSKTKPDRGSPFNNRKDDRFYGDSSETEVSDTANQEYVAGNLLLPRIVTSSSSAEKLQPAIRSPNLNDNSHAHDEKMRRKQKPSLPDITINNSGPIDATDLTTSSSQGRYSPLSGTFHYPDLFMESLTKSPKFKATSRSLTEVVHEMTSRKPINIESYPAATDITTQITNLKPKTTSSHHYKDGTPLFNRELFPSTSSFNDTESEELSSENDPAGYWHKDEDSDSERTASDDEDSSDDDHYDIEFENDTYHPTDNTPLSFEQALAISNPKRGVSPTNDMFLESETYYRKQDEGDYGLHYFNRNYEEADDDMIDRERKTKEPGHIGRPERQPKSILKSAYSESSRTNSPVSTLTRGNMNFEDQHFSYNKSPKKQVRIEEPTKPTSSVKPPDEGDTSHVVINHYSDIVKQFGNAQKPSVKVYMTYDELKAAAQKSEQEVQFDFTDDHRVQDTSICDRQGPDDGHIERNDTIAGQPVHTVIAQKVHQKVHFFFDFFLDLIMFATACWLYCFKDERLAIPVILLMVYRQLYDKVKNKVSGFKFWRRKKSE